MSKYIYIKKKIRVSYFNNSVHDVDKKYYADGEDALAMRLTLKETKPVTRKIVEEVNTVAAH